MTFLLHHLVSEAASAHPGQLAVADGDRRLSYAELEARSNQLAWLLRERGVRRGDRVGIFLEKSLEAIVALYGAMKAGAAYVPLDPGAPVMRVGSMANDCGLKALLSETGRGPLWERIAKQATALEIIVALDSGDAPAGPPDVTLLTSRDLDGQPTGAPPGQGIDEDLAYILYTSGSTGRPKGVMLSHRNALEFVLWAAREFSLRPPDRLSQFAPLHFDLSTFDLFAAARAAASVHLVPRATLVFPLQVRKFLEEHAITVMYCVPSILSLLTERAMLNPGDLSHVRAVLFAGEVFPTKYLSRLMQLLPHADFANLYGPTETNVCTCYRLGEVPRETDPPIPIGRAIDNVETLVVTEEGRRAAPGEVGELYVRGGTVMRGYWGDPARTQTACVAHPFQPELRDPVYRTGDLVIEREDGNYELLGRRDTQIKSRGYRIELGEIESTLYAHPEVVECAVVALPDEMITHRLKAFVLARETLKEADLRSFCAKRLPTYMIPEQFEFRRSLPKTSTGKIDRQSLVSSRLDECGGQT
jgi:amino acid adenylation domain-containing protein